jgi:hypothetical protein
MSNFDAVLKEFYEGLIREQLNNEIMLKKWLKQSSRSWSGRRVVFPVHLRRNVGVGARSEAAALPTAGQQTNVESRVTSAYIYGRIDLTGQVMASSKNAFADALAHEMEGVTSDLQFDCTRQSYGEGLGILAQVALDSNSASSVTVFNQYVEPGQPGARFIQAGQRITAGSISSPTADTSGVDVVTVSIATNSGTTSDTVLITATNLNFSASDTYLFNLAAGGAGVELKGLRGLVDDSTSAHVYGYSGGMLGTVTLQNISADTQNKWRGNVLANSQTERLLDSRLMQKAFDQTKKQSGKTPDLIIGEYDVISAFLDSVSNDRRYDTKEFDAGRGALSYNGIDMVQDLLAPYNELYLLNKEAIQFYVLKDYGFADEDGNILKNVSGYDEWEAFIKAYFQIGVEHRNALTVIRDIRTSL